MKNFYLFTLIVTLTLVSNKMFAQDIHFSQTRFAPLNLNPGLTGAEHSLQAVANYRNQWNSVAEPFSTIAASFESRLKEKYGQKGFLALGVNFFNDVAGDVRMTTTNASANVAYHILLDRNSTLGLGIQTGFGQRGISPQNGLWSSQFQNGEFNTSIPSGENFGELSFSHFDLASGMVYSYSRRESAIRANDHLHFTGGVGAYHVNMPQNTFLVGGEDALAVRWTAFSHADIGFKNTNWGVMPGAYFHRQGPHMEIMAGTYVKTIVIDPSKVTGFIDGVAISYGAFYRFGDAFVNKLLVEMGTYSLGFSYDFNISSLTQASRGRGGMEFFLRYFIPNVYVKKKARIN